jgi:hypothetical protein
VRGKNGFYLAQHWLCIKYVSEPKSLQFNLPL